MAEKNVISQRFNFYQRCQHAEETFYTFLENIRNLAEQCEFHVEEKGLLIRDRLVCGLNDANLKLKIISDGGNPSAEHVLEICNKYNSFESLNFDIEESEFIADNDSIKTDEEELNINDQKEIDSESIEETKADKSKYSNDIEVL